MQAFNSQAPAPKAIVKWDLLRLRFECELYTQVQWRRRLLLWPPLPPRARSRNPALHVGDGARPASRALWSSGTSFPLGHAVPWEKLNKQRHVLKSGRQNHTQVDSPRVMKRCRREPGSSRGRKRLFLRQRALAELVTSHSSGTVPLTTRP